MLFSSHQKKTKKAQPKWLRFFYAKMVDCGRINKNPNIRGVYLLWARKRNGLKRMIVILKEFHQRRKRHQLHHQSSLKNEVIYIG